MKAIRKLGICMDHSIAYILEYKPDNIETKIITLKFTHDEKENSLSKGESHMQIKEQHLQAEYYKELGEIIKHYNEVIIFGPTEAKIELFHVLRTDHLFSDIKIDVKKTDKMTEVQQHIFVKEYFSKKA